MRSTPMTRRLLPPALLFLTVSILTGCASQSSGYSYGGAGFSDCDFGDCEGEADESGGAGCC